MKRINHKAYIMLAPVLLSSCTFTFTMSSSKQTDLSSLSEGDDRSSVPFSSDDSSSPSSLPSSLAIDPTHDFAPEGYSLKWSDEFDGNSLSMANWSYQIGNNGGWGNNEAQYYTDHNDVVSDGTLKIWARREEEGDFHYTSTRIHTYQKVSTTYGYICARIKLPAVPGMWPAFWMLPERNYGSEGVTWWPTSGEIDIMESKGRVPTRASGALHYSSNGSGGNHAYQTREKVVDSTENYHVYAIDWSAEIIRWYVDGEQYFSVNRGLWNAGYGTGDASPFNRPFHILFNMAVAGQFDNYTYPPDDWQSSAMEVDYVRIYQAG